MVFFKVSSARVPAPQPVKSDWTRSFRPQSAWRTGQLTLWTMTACALVLPISFSRQTQAESSPDAATVSSDAPASQPPAPGADTATSQSATSSAASSPDAPATQTAPAPEQAPAISGAPTTQAAPATAPAIPSAPAKTASPNALQLTAIVAGVTQRESLVPTPGMTVGQALDAMGIALSSLDRVAPAASTPVAPGMTMRVTRVAVELRTRREPIAAQTRYLPTTKLRAGAKQTTQHARAGYTEIVEKVWLKDGKESGREFVSRKVGRAPQNQVIALGVNSRFMPGNIAPHRRYARALTYRGGSPRDRAAAQNSGDGALFATGQLRVVKTLKMMTTGYNGAEMGGGGPRTATGIRCAYGAIAVDPRVIPLGSQLYVEGYGYGFACDTGGAIKGNHIDLAFDSVRAANNHGKVRGVTVYILGK